MTASVRSVYLEEKLLATQIPQSPYFVYEERKVNAESKYVLSRFAYLHADRNQIVVESPLSYSRVILHHWIASAVIHMLAQPVSAKDLCRMIPELPEATASELISLLLSSGIVRELNNLGLSREDGIASLQSWEFHDFLFHSRSRGGRHDHPSGGTYRLAGILDPPPVLKKMNRGKFLPLYRPDLEKLQQKDPAYARVQEERCSIREYAKEPISIQQLGEFLYRVGRVSDFQKTAINTPHGVLQMDLAFRPFPSGGGLYEMELYLAINRCEGLASGLYYYDPEKHCLLLLSGMTADVEGLVKDAGRATLIPDKQIQTLIILAARFQRLAWKYSTIAYSLMLKNVGALYQTMYLAATAMGLAPCAVGYGDSDLFARAAGTEYYTETSIGEFLLGSRL
ncbi:SagB family peptide dehydrogenase [bacterium]|nr:SagB family peptide dehydrogenase [bacterium]MCI0603924.1 SagB family peptide dehydrogenase [bacterium]